jgi:hypothetical protein
MRPARDSAATGTGWSAFLVGIAVVAAAVFALVVPAGRADAASPAPNASSAAPIRGHVLQLPGIPSPCDLAPIEILKDGCKAATDVTAIPGAVVGAVDKATGGVVNNIFDSALGWFAALLSDTVKSAMSGLGDAMSNSPKAPLDTSWFASEYGTLLVVGVGLCFFVFIYHLLWNAMRFKSWEMLRTFRYFLLAVFLTATAPFFIQMMLQFADALTSAFAGIGGQQAGQLADKITDVTSTITNTGGLDAVKPLILILVLLVAVVLVIFWMILLAIRSLIIYVGTLAVPFVLPSIIDGKGRFAKLYFNLLFGVIIAAPILFGTLCFGAMLLRDGYVGKDGLWPLLTGIALIAIASFLPFVVIRLLAPAAAPMVAVVERGGHRVVDVVRSGAHKATVLAAGAVTGGAALTAGVAAGGAGAAALSSARSAPPRPRSAAPPDSGAGGWSAPPRPRGDVP